MIQGCDKVYNSDFISKVVLIKRTLILNVVSPHIRMLHSRCNNLGSRNSKGNDMRHV
jgi:hypothetical protein